MKSKGLFFILLMLLLIAVIGLALPRVQNIFRPKATGTASLSLPASVAATSGVQFLVPITLAVTGSVRGVDVALNFDKTKLQLTGIEETAKTAGNASFKTFVPGVAGGTTGLLDSATVMNNANATGKMEIGAVTYDYSGNQAAPPTGTYGLTPAFSNNTVVLATAKFTPVAVASQTTTNVTLDYTAGSTTDSNVIDDDAISVTAPYLNDILSSVSPVGGTAVTISPASAPTTNLLIKAKFAGISTDKGTITATRVIVQDRLTTHAFKQTFNNVPFNFVSGVYQATVSNLNLTAANYEILIKGPSHLQTRVTPNGFSVSTSDLGTTKTVDTTTSTVRGGDVINKTTTPPSNGQDGQLTLEDLTAITYYYTDISVPVPGTQNIPLIRDINKDGQITIDDVTLISNNFTTVTVNDDQ